MTRNARAIPCAVDESAVVADVGAGQQVEPVRRGEVLSLKARLRMRGRLRPAERVRPTHFRGDHGSASRRGDRGKRWGRERGSIAPATATGEGGRIVGAGVGQDNNGEIVAGVAGELGAEACQEPPR